MYNGALVVLVAKKASIIGFAIDLAVVVIVNETYAIETISVLKVVQFGFAEQKTEAVYQP